jgi:hypothetical protein
MGSGIDRKEQPCPLNIQSNSVNICCALILCQVLFDILKTIIIKINALLITLVC